MSKRARPKTQVPPEIDPKIRDLMTALLDKTVQLIMKVATCKCDKRDNCRVYECAREVAVVVDKIQTLRPARIPLERATRAEPTGVA